MQMLLQSRREQTDAFKTLLFSFLCGNMSNLKWPLNDSVILRGAIGFAFVILWELEYCKYKIK